VRGGGLYAGNFGKAVVFKLGSAKGSQGYIYCLYSKKGVESREIFQFKNGFNWWKKFEKQAV
jgi:hypothetical protein